MIKRNKLREYVSWYLLLLIPLVGTLVFNEYPLIQTVMDSFENMKGMFIGLVNYQILWEDDTFRQSVVNTLYMAVLGVCFVSALFGIYAMIAFRPFKGLK